jgi:hypothetical protein
LPEQRFTDISSSGCLGATLIGLVFLLNLLLMDRWCRLLWTLQTKDHHRSDQAFTCSVVRSRHSADSNSTGTWFS